MPFNDMNIEIERKFLIRMPSSNNLNAQKDVCVKNLEQTYLTSDGSYNARVRSIDEGGRVRYVKTVKRRISVLSCYEDEFEISEAQYQEELKNADKSKTAIKKTRYCIPFGEHIVEIDVFPFWSDRAILEVELKNEDEEFSLPSFVEIIKEVSDDKRYKNTNLALEIPMDDI